MPDPKARISTDVGDVDVELYVRQAPLSAGDFLRYVDEDRYRDAAFYRVVRPERDVVMPSIAVVQGGLMDAARALPPVPHESTDATGIHHTDGTVSLARGAPGTGSAAAFFICVGDQPALDRGGLRNPDGLGFAAFGRVIAGGDVVRAIHGRETSAEAPAPQLANQMLAQPVAIRGVRRL